MAINERGLWASVTLDERGRSVFNNLDERGQFIITFGIPIESTSAPVPTIISVSRSKISDETGVNFVEVRFSFDTNVTQWSVNVMGVDQTTGTIADSGGAVSAGQEIVAVIDWTELYQEGQNRVNIYGRNSNGEWTLYES